MNNVAFTEAMIWVFGFVALVAWLIHTAEKDMAKKKEAAKESNDASHAEEQSGKDEHKNEPNGEGHLGAIVISLVGLVFSIVMHISYKSDYESLLGKFKKGDDIYCYSSSFDSKWEKVNKSDGWYLEEETLKHKDKGLKFGIYRCKESF